MATVTMTSYRVTDHRHVDEEALKQCPHVVAGVDFLHLDFRVDVAVVEEVDVRVLHLENNITDTHSAVSTHTTKPS